MVIHRSTKQSHVAGCGFLRFVRQTVGIFESGVFMPSSWATCVMVWAKFSSLYPKFSAKTAAQSLADLTINASMQVLTLTVCPARSPKFWRSHVGCMAADFEVVSHFDKPFVQSVKSNVKSHDFGKGSGVTQGIRSAGGKDFAIFSIYDDWRCCGVSLCREAKA